MNFDALTTIQYQVVHRHQLLRAGVSASAIQRRLRSGEWQRLLPAVYALFSDPPDTRQRQVAALLYAGADAQLGGVTALGLHGLRRLAPDDRIHLLVPHHRQVSSAGFALLHRTSREVVPGYLRRLPFSPLPRAVADAARWGADPAQLRVIVAEAVGRGLTTVATLRAELSGSQRNGTRALRAALAELAGTASLEPGQPPGAGDLRTSLLQSRLLPRIVWNPRLRGVDGRPLPAPDGWIPDAALGLEIDGYGGGPAPDEWEHAEARRGLLAEYGALILQFPPSRLRQDPTGVRRTVERAYLQRRGCGLRAPIRVA